MGIVHYCMHIFQQIQTDYWMNLAIKSGQSSEENLSNALSASSKVTSLSKVEKLNLSKSKNLVSILQISVTSFLDFISILSPLAYRSRTFKMIHARSWDELKFGIIENTSSGLDLCYDMICVTRDYVMQRSVT